MGSCFTFKALGTIGNKLIAIAAAPVPCLNRAAELHVVPGMVAGRVVALSQFSGRWCAHLAVSHRFLAGRQRQALAGRGGEIKRRKFYGR